MFDGIPLTVLSSIGPAALASLAVLLVFFGGLIPRWMHNERIKDKDTRITYLEAALDKRDAQVGRLLDNHELIISLLNSIKSEAERRHL